MRHLLSLSLIIFAWLASPGLATSQIPSTQQPATPVENTSLENFYRVSDEVFRSGQPNAAQMQELQQRGFKSILNLRQFNSDTKEAQGTDLQLFHVRMNAGEFSDQQVVEALKFLHNAPKPILVHCWHGSDRTGMIIAMYRIIYQDWSKQEAINELLQPQFGHHKNIYKNIPRYLQQVDVEAIKAQIMPVRDH